MKPNMQKENRVELPSGFTARGASLADAELSMALFNRWSNAVIGRDDFKGAESIRNEWEAPGVDPAEDIRLVFAPNGELAGYGEVWTTGKPPAHPDLWGRVDPEYEGMGIGTWLMHWEEQRALQALPLVPAEMRFSFRLPPGLFFTS